MGVKIELEPKEVGQIISALNCYRDEKEKIIKKKYKLSFD